MNLLEKLKDERAEKEERLQRAVADVGYFTKCVVDLDRAIAALSVPEVAEVEIPDGFTRHDGNGCPVDRDALVEVQYGDRTIGLAEAWRLSGEGNDSAGDHWKRKCPDLPYPSMSDIIAYRVLPIEPAAEAKGEEFVGVEFMGGNSNDGGDGYARFAAFKKPDPFVASTQHAEESALAQSLPPLFKPEPPQAATPEQLMESGAINGEAYGLWRKLAKVEA